MGKMRFLELSLNTHPINIFAYSVYPQNQMQLSNIHTQCFKHNMIVP